MSGRSLPLNGFVTKSPAGEESGCRAASSPPLLKGGEGGFKGGWRDCIDRGRRSSSLENSSFIEKTSSMHFLAAALRSSMGISLPRICFMDVIITPWSPQGLTHVKGSRSVFTFKARPWKDTERRTAMPMLPILFGPTQAPRLRGFRSALMAHSARAVIGDVSSPLHVDEGDTARSEKGFGHLEVRMTSSSSKGKNGRVLQKEHHVVFQQVVLPGIDEAQLQRPGLPVVHQAQVQEEPFFS